MISHANDFRSLRNLIRPVVGRAPAARSGRRAAAVGPGIRGLRRCIGTGGGTPSAPGLGGVMFSFLVGCMCIEFPLYIWIYEKTHLKTQLYTMVNVTHYISFYLIMMLKAVSD